MGRHSYKYEVKTYITPKNKQCPDADTSRPLVNPFIKNGQEIDSGVNNYSMSPIMQLYRWLGSDTPWWLKAYRWVMNLFKSTSRQENKIAPTIAGYNSSR